MCARDVRHHRAGMTLTELLVVVAVMVILIGMAVPMMRNGIEERKLREASRQFNTAFALAKSMAAETGRPAGVWIDTQPGTSFAEQVFLAESPPPYSGDVVGAQVTITAVTPTTGSALFAATGTFSLKSLVNLNDLIKFNYKGPLYRITAISGAAPPFSITFDVTGLPAPPLNSITPYQIFRQPSKSSSIPLELPAGAVIDVGSSGLGLTDITFTTGASVTSPIVVMFQPDGSVERLWIVNGVTPAVYPTDTIHFLVGKIEQASEDVNSPKRKSLAINTQVRFTTNVTDPTCLWVSVAPKAGRVTTAENAWAFLPSPPVTVYVDDSLTAARQYAQSGQSMGGR